MTTDTRCTRELISELARPVENLTTLLSLVPTLDDSLTPRAQLITYLHILADYFEEITETLALHARNGGAE